MYNLFILCKEGFHSGAQPKAVYCVLKISRYMNVCQWFVRLDCSQSLDGRLLLEIVMEKQLRQLHMSDTFRVVFLTCG